MGSLATLVGLLELPWPHKDQGAGWPEACLLLSLGGSTVREGGMKMYLYGNGHINGGVVCPPGQTGGMHWPRPFELRGWLCLEPGGLLVLLQHLHMSFSFCSSACVVFSVCVKKASA